MLVGKRIKVTLIRSPDSSLSEHTTTRCVSGLCTQTDVSKQLLQHTGMRDGSVTRQAVYIWQLPAIRCTNLCLSRVNEQILSTNLLLYRVGLRMRTNVQQSDQTVSVYSNIIRLVCLNIMVLGTLFVTFHSWL